MAYKDVLINRLFSLENKVALVTGATGGLGMSMCLALAEAGADIISIQRPQDAGSSILQEHVKALGRKISIFECDLQESEAIRSTLRSVWAAGHTPSILLNCAGVNRRGPIEKYDDETIDWIFSINLKASYVIAQEFGKRLLELDHPGKIINIASLTSFLANVNVSAYAATKGGVLQMTKAFSNEWASKGIQVNCICPGYFRTPLTTELTNNTEFAESIIKRTPAGRWGEPDDLQGAVVFLASAASDFVSGHSLVVDGGMLGR